MICYFHDKRVIVTLLVSSRLCVTPIFATVLSAKNPSPSPAFRAFHSSDLCTERVERVFSKTICQPSSAHRQTEKEKKKNGCKNKFRKEGVRIAAIRASAGSQTDVDILCYEKGMANILRKPQCSLFCIEEF